MSVPEGGNKNYKEMQDRNRGGFDQDPERDSNHVVGTAPEHHPHL